MDGYGQTQKVVDRPADADHCLVIDVSNLAYRSAYAYKELATKAGEPTGHIYGSVRLLLSTLKNDLGPGKWCMVFCYDGVGAKQARQQVLPEYKANREDGRFNPLPDVADVLRWVPGLHIEAAEKEGDDAIAWAAAHIHRKTGCGVTLLTGDKDLWALTTMERVRVLSPNLKRFVTPEDIQKNYHVEDPRKIYLAKALFGDTSDGIRGVTRLQKKAVAPYLNRDGVLGPDHLYTALKAAEWEGLTVKTRAKLEDAKDQVARNFKVIMPRIKGFDQETVTRVRTTKADQEALRRTLLRYECNALAEQLSPLYGEAQYVKVQS